METLEYSCTYNGQEYSIYVASYNTYLKPVSVTIIDGIHVLQTFTYATANKTILSYTSPSLPPQFAAILSACLTHLHYPLPYGLSHTVPTIVFQKRQTAHVDTLIFTTATHSFRAVIKEEPYHFSLKVGGKEFVGCVELFIDKPDTPFYKPPKLAQVYSEPECWYQLGKKGKIVDLLKGTFQLCQMLFGVNTFFLEDNSNVECGVTNARQMPPRKLEKPFSLAHVSIAEKKQTWYEIQFNAFIRDVENRKAYHASLKRLHDETAKPADFEQFAAIARLNKEQYTYLKPLYETSFTWNAFFQKIPKENQCMALFNWLPEYMDRYILKFQPTKQEWCICLEPLGISEKEEMCTSPMERTDVMIQMVPTKQWGGLRKPRKSRQTRKRTLSVLSFSNQF